jgi:DNA polymerase III epsilon subunit-like protein
MKLLILDTETTGLSPTKLISPDTLNMWPYIIQLSYLIFDTEVNDILLIYDNIIKIKDGTIISEDVSKINGITYEISQKKGIFIEEALINLFNDLKHVDKIIGHNISFDINMIRVELLRLIYNENHKNDITFLKECKYNLHFITNTKNICCTLKDSIKLCNIQATDIHGKSYLKYPKLLELHIKLFDSIPKNLHNSLNDILVTLRCYMKMKFDKDLLEYCHQYKYLSNKLEIYDFK